MKILMFLLMVCWFMDYSCAMKWDDETMKVTGSIPGELNPCLPVMYMETKRNFTPNPTDYNAPIYTCIRQVHILVYYQRQVTLLLLLDSHHTSLKTTGYCSTFVSWVNKNGTYC